MEITNSAKPLTSWRLTFTLAGGEKAIQGWNADRSRNGTTVTVGNAGWNGAPATGVTVGTGFLGSRSGAAPTSFKRNGRTCTTAWTLAPTPIRPWPNSTGPGTPATRAHLRRQPRRRWCSPMCHALRPVLPPGRRLLPVPRQVAHRGNGRRCLCAPTGLPVAVSDRTPAAVADVTGRHALDGA
ncbi:cellulose binding domain-containing protein [Streptomyces sp. CA-249302]|uniref:cellulose binding domain-containing protein n=1 Tax=Streptomyces sp. CA-249302 TaxID=3240058 RepID=UPI003D8A84E7